METLIYDLTEEDVLAAGDFMSPVDCAIATMLKRHGHTLGSEELCGVGIDAAGIDGENWEIVNGHEVADAGTIKKFYRRAEAGQKFKHRITFKK